MATTHKRQTVKNWARTERLDKETAAKKKLVGQTISVHNGRRSFPVTVTEQMVEESARLGKFIPTSASISGLRIAPRKVRIVVDTIRGKAVGEALNILQYTRKSAALPVAKLLKSALANAEKKGLDVDGLVVSAVMVDQGPTMRRFMPRALGRAFRVNKKTSHVYLELDTKA